MSNDLFLCLDTATPTARVAVLDGTGAVRHAAEATAERHAVAGRAAIGGPTAISVGRLALLQRARGEAANLATAVPIYGRPPDITVKKPRV